MPGSDIRPSLSSVLWNPEQCDEGLSAHDPPSSTAWLIIRKPGTFTHNEDIGSFYFTLASTILQETYSKSPISMPGSMASRTANLARSNNNVPDA
eukprot:scaffold172730_cov39-Prasinocladus_malaysianus.AAC.2